MFPRTVDIYEAITDHVPDGLVDLPQGLSFDTYQQNICGKILTGMCVMHTPSIPTPTDSFNHSNNLRGRPRIMKFFTITFFTQPQYTTGFLVGNLKRDCLEDRGTAGRIILKMDLKEIIR